MLANISILSKPLKIIVTLVLFLIALSMFLYPINFVTADLGRHMKNGEIFLKEGKIIDTNFYSYTENDRPTVNHHWGSGLIYYLVYHVSGFKGLVLLNIFCMTIAFYLLFNLAVKLSSFHFAFFSSVLSLPFISFRHDIRPETFSYLCIAIFLTGLFALRERRNLIWIVLLAALELLWVNLHIFFIFGPVLTTIFIVDAYIHRKQNLQIFLMLFMILCVVTLVNPWGLKGALMPFNIFKSYGYMVAENQSLFFLQQRFVTQLGYVYFEIIYLVCIVLIISGFILRKAKNFFLPISIRLIVGVLSFNTMRMTALWGWLFIPLGAWLGQGIIERSLIHKKWVDRWIIFLIIILLILDLKFGCSWARIKESFDVLPQSNRSAQFFKEHRLRGPIFNNYDIGSYLIFHLFPQEKVFVDNRPESYSVGFFKDVYVPMQEREGLWQKLSAQYQFNAIYFYRNDLTPWTQPFLIRRLNDPEWAPVYVDDYVLILLRRTAQNANIIHIFELPKNIFVAGQR